MKRGQWNALVFISLVFILTVMVSFLGPTMTGYFSAMGGSPSINFVDPTPDNNTITTNKIVPVNISIKESNLGEILFDWNGTNYTIFDDSFVLMMNFGNRSELGENNTHIYDVSSTGNNGTVLGGASWSEGGGKYNGAFNFDGVDNKINIPHNESHHRISNEGSWVFWLKLRTYDTCQAFLSKRDSFNANNAWGTGVNFEGDPSIINFEYSIGGGLHNQTKFNSSSIPLNIWNMVVFVFNSSDTAQNGRMYVNGKEISPLSKQNPNQPINTTTDSDIFIGAVNNGSTCYLNGSIDEVMILNKSLSQSTIQELYFADLQRYNKTQWNLFVNQSKNSTSGLDAGTYSYQGFAADSGGNISSTGKRLITIGNLTPPQISFVDPTPPNNTNISNDSVTINISVKNGTSLNEILFNWNGTDYVFYNDDLVLMYNFDKIGVLGENDSYVVDVSKYGNDGSLTGGSLGNGKYGKGLVLNGVDDYFNTSKITPIHNKSIRNFAFEVWFKSTGDTGEIQQILEGHTKTGEIRVEGELPGSLEFFLEDDNGNSHEGNTNSLALNKWHHLMGTYNGTNLKYYVDGEIISSDSGFDSNLTLTTPITIGRDLESNIQHFKGTIDEVRIWNRIFNDEEVRQHYFTNLRKNDVDKWNLEVEESNLTDSVYTFQSCVNASGVRNCTETRRITIDTTAPIIDVIRPEEITYRKDKIDFDISLNEKGNCKFSLDGGGDISMNKVNDTYFNYTSSNLSEGQHEVIFYCNDNVGNLRSAAKNFAVDTFPPVVSLGFPLTGRRLNYETVTFNYTPYPNGGNLSTCKLYGNWSGWHANQTENSPVNGTTNNFNVTLKDGSYKWNVWCNESSANSDFSAQGNQTFSIDKSSPSVNIENPENKTYITSTIDFNVSSNEDLDFCKFSVDNWNTNKTMTRLNSKYFYFNGYFLSDGSYTARFWCNDSSGNVNNTEEVSFEVNTSVPKVTLVSPANGTQTTSKTNTFTCDAKDDLGLKNISLFVWDSGSNIFYNNTRNVSGLSSQESWTVSGFSIESYKWNCLVYDDSSFKDWGDDNYSLSIDGEGGGTFIPKCEDECYPDGLQCVNLYTYLKCIKVDGCYSWETKKVPSEYECRNDELVKENVSLVERPVKEIKPGPDGFSERQLIDLSYSIVPIFEVKELSEEEKEELRPERTIKITFRNRGSKVIKNLSVGVEDIVIDEPIPSLLHKFLDFALGKALRIETTVVSEKPLHSYIVEPIIIGVIMPGEEIEREIKIKQGLGVNDKELLLKLTSYGYVFETYRQRVSVEVPELGMFLEVNEEKGLMDLYLILENKENRSKNITVERGLSRKASKDYRPSLGLLGLFKALFNGPKTLNADLLGPYELGAGGKLLIGQRYLYSNKLTGDYIFSVKSFEDLEKIMSLEENITIKR